VTDGENTSLYLWPCLLRQLEIAPIELAIAVHRKRYETVAVRAID
jgi:hypothetical protein